jgi:hypothetical protein
MSDVFDIWTIYDHPTDFPDNFVARRFEIAGPRPLITGDVLVARSLEALRAWMQSRDLFCIQRTVDDDEKIVETWV